jgi:hypothetical protein
LFRKTYGDAIDAKFDIKGQKRHFWVFWAILDQENPCMTRFALGAIFRVGGCQGKKKVRHRSDIALIRHPWNSA